MDEGLNYLQTFNPTESKPDLLEHTLVGRKDLVDRLEQLVIESSNSGNKLQRLIIGPRGSGKTHTFKVLHNRILKNTELADKLKIAYLCEDEYGVATFLDWIIRILRSFVRWDAKSAEYIESQIEAIKKTPTRDQEKLAVQTLLEQIKNKTLLIIVENIGDIFHKKNGFGKKGQQKFRDLIQQHPYFTIMASSQALFDDLQREDMPFHNFFKIIYLKKLSFEESYTLLNTIAQWDKNQNLVSFLNTEIGKGRIKAIYDLIGGNHRLLVTFYNFLKTDYIHMLSESFMKTINDLIPYYQSMMDILSSQQQKIVQYMCQARNAVNVKTIAENCFSAENTVSSQLKKLVTLKYVDAIRSGRETYYELAEPLLRICNEVKENKGGPVKLFVDFLGNIYSAEEIKQRFMKFHILSKNSQKQLCTNNSHEKAYYKAALENYFSDSNILSNMKSFEEAGDDIQIKTYIGELEKINKYTDIISFASLLSEKDKFMQIKEANAYEKIGDVEKAIQTGKELLKKDNNYIDALSLIAQALFEADKYIKARKYFEKIIKLDDKNAIAIKSLGIIFGKQGDYQQAYNYFDQLIKLEPENSKNWTVLGLSQFLLGKTEEAKDSYLKAIELDDKNTFAIKYLGIIFGNQGDHQKAHYYFDQLTKLEPDDSEGWRLLGHSQDNLGKTEEAKKSLLKAIKLDKNNYEEISFYLSILIKDQAIDEAQIYLSTILDEYSENSDALNSIGEVYRKNSLFKKAIPIYTQAIKANHGSIWPYFNLVSCALGLNDIESAFQHLEDAMKIASKHKIADQIIQCFEENFTTLFLHASFENISDYLEKALGIIEKHSFTEQFNKSLPKTVFNLLQQHNTIEINRFEAIEKCMQNLAKEHRAMIVPLKYLNIGIRHFKLNEKNVLMKFTKEERATFNKFVPDSK